MSRAEASVIAARAERSAWVEVRRVAAAVVETTKPRITKLVVVTAGVGFALGALGRSWTAAEFMLAGAWCLIGTALCAAGANALNQWMERDRDARMTRTAGRPLPDGRLTPGQVLAGGLLMGACGAGVLWWGAGAVAATVGLATMAIYLLLYTPLKPVTSLATLVGAIPGALPPLIGWAAADADSGWRALASPGAWSLFLIMFVWQIPHFLAIAWMYREDYARGGYRVLPSGPGAESWAAAVILAWTVLLVPVTLAPGILMDRGPGPGYFVAALASGLGFLALAARLCRARTREAARAAFLGSIVHLPLLLVVLLADAAISALW